MRKEWLLLRRDIGGLLMLLIMPAALITIMALVQDAPFRDYQEMHFDLLLADEDGGALAQEIKTGLKESANFTVIDGERGKAFDNSSLRKTLGNGKYHVGIVIPKGATAEVANAANIVANSLAEKLGTGHLPQREARDSIVVRLYFDPAAKPAFRVALRAALDKYITASCSRLLVTRISRLAGADTSNAPDLQKVVNGIGIRESSLAGEGKAEPHLSSVQHNVPAWAIFGMFFIVVPLSGHIIREREEGSSLRVSLIPGAERGVALGRILFNTLICCLQFVLMCCIGIWFLPLLGLAPLSMGSHPAVLVPMIIAIALAATAYGYTVGTVFRTSNQALPFGAISIVILSALGGVWIPVEVLPSVLQAIAKLSPMHWALQGVQNIMLRNGSWGDVLVPIGVLLLFTASMWAIGVAYQRLRRA
jgi:ABC-2 type transport system permease protein